MHTGLSVQDSVSEKVVVVAADTVREVTTVTVDRNEAGDTLRLTQVTERDRVRDRAQASAVIEKVVVKTDTVYVEKRDSVVVSSSGFRDAGGGGGFATGLRGVLKWAFWLVVALAVLIGVIRFGRKGLLV